MHENELAKIIVDTAFHVHQALGPGMLESVYRVVLAYELRKRGLEVLRDEPISFRYESLFFKKAFEADLIVAGKVIIEVKSVETLSRAHKKQLLTYLRLTNIKLGFVINFGDYYFKDGIARVINGELDLEE